MWSEKKAAVVWGLITLVACVAVAVAFGATKRTYGGATPFENGQVWGRALAPVIIGVPVIAYFVQKRRRAR